MNLRKWLTEENEALWDKAIRVIAGAVLLAIYAFGPNFGILGYVLLLFGLVGLFTGVTGHCLLYVPFNFTTKGMFEGGEKLAKKKKRKR